MALWVGKVNRRHPTHRHADVTSELITELPHLAGNLFHDAARHPANLHPRYRF
jgi:hypothetical protein